MGRKSWQMGKREGIDVWLHRIMCLFIVYMNGIVFISFAYSNLFPHIAYNFLCAEPASLGPGENPASCFHPQMCLVGMRCLACHAENPAILIRRRWLSLSISTWTPPVTFAPPGHCLGLRSCWTNTAGGCNCSLPYLRSLLWEKL